MARDPKDVRPSGAGTWVVCTGNIDMRAMFPDAPDEADSEVTEDGTACHWLASEIWEQRPRVVDTLAPNGRVLTDEMFDAVDTYHNVLRAWPNVAPVCEQSIPIPRILIGMKGTPDAWAYNPDLKRLYIADLKFGFRFVEVWYNWQLMCYACGLLDLLGLDWATTSIEFVIVQPRSYHREGPVRKWVVKSAMELMPYVERLRIAANAPAMYVPNPGCYDCPGRHVCVAYQNAALQAMEIAYTGDPYELPPAALGAELRLLKDAEKKLAGRISGLETQADSMLRRGKTIPGWVLKPSFAREGYVEDGERRLLAIAHLIGADIAKPARAITPKQARAKMPSVLVDAFAHKPSTGLRLTKQDPLEAKKAFDQ